MKHSLVNCDAIGAREAKKKRASGPFRQFQHPHPFCRGHHRTSIYVRSVKRERFGKKASGLCHQLDHPHPLAGVIEHLSIHTALQIFELYYTFERGHPASSVAAPSFWRSLSIAVLL